MESVISKPDYQIAVTLDGGFILLKQKPNTLVMTDAMTEQPINNLKLREKKYRNPKKISIKNVAKSINGAWLIFVYEDNTFTEWLLAQIFTETNTDPLFIYRSVSQNGRWALRETKGGCIQLHNLITGEITPIGYGILPRITKNDKFFWYKILLSNDAQFVVRVRIENDSWEQESDLLLINLMKRKTTPILLSYGLKNDEIITLTLSEDSKLLWVGFNDGSIVVYRVQDSQKLFQSYVYNYPVTFIAEKTIDEGLAIISSASNGEICVFTKQTKRNIRYKLNNLINMAFFTPDNQHIIVGEMTRDNEQYHVFEIVATSDNIDNSQISLLSQQVIETKESKKYYVLLYDVKTENEGIHSLRENNKEIILLFESHANAEFFVQGLKDQGFRVPTVEQINEYDIKHFCQQSGYSWEIVPDRENKLIEKDLRFELAPAELFPTIGVVYGPGLILWKFYINKHLYYEKENYVKASHFTFINIVAPLYLETFTEDTEGHIMFFPDDRHIYYKLKITISPLIIKESDWKSHRAYDVTFEYVPSQTIYNRYGMRTDSQFEEQLLRFLDFQEQLFGTEHEQLIKTLDKLVQVYEAQGKETEAETTMLRKLELEELYKPQEIILSANQSRNVAYTLFSIYRIPLQFLIDLLEINYLAGISFLEKKFYTTTDGYPYSSCIKLKVSPDKIVDSQSENVTVKNNQIDGKLNVDIFQQINNYSNEVTNNIFFLFEPDGYQLTLFKKAWYNFKLLIDSFNFKADWQYLVNEFKGLDFVNQLRRLKNSPKNVFNSVTTLIFFFFLIMVFIVIQSKHYFNNFQDVSIDNYILFNFLQIIKGLSFTFLGLIFFEYIFIIPFLYITKIININILNYVNNYIDQNPNNQELKWFLLVGLTLLPLPLIILFLWGISFGAIKLAEILGNWFGGIKLAEMIGNWTLNLPSQPYWSILSLVSFIVSILYLGKWLLKEKRVKTRLIFRVASNMFSTAFVGALMANLLGYYINGWFGQPFNSSSFLFIFSLSTLGAFSNLSDQRQQITLYHLIGVLIIIYILSKYPLASLLNQSVFSWIGKIIGALVGGFIGFWGGVVLAGVIGIFALYLFLTVYLIVKKAIKNLENKGYQKVFGIIFFTIIILLGSCTGILLGFLF